MLYIALLVPAVLSIVFYLASTMAIIYLRPDSAPGRTPFDARELVRALWRSFSAFVMFATVIGGIFAGVFTATEAAAVGVLIAFVVALVRGKLRGATIREEPGLREVRVADLYDQVRGRLLGRAG
mgnify:CR=1 FL=1